MEMLARLFDLLFPLRNTARIVAESTDAEFGRLMSPTTLPSGVTALLPYRHRVVRAAVIEAKFKKNPRAFRLLGTVLTEYLAARAEEVRAFEEGTYVLVPVPLSDGRRKERGYNQVEEILKAAGCTYQSLLVRTRDTAPQTSLRRRERLENMKDSFVAAGQLDSNVTYIVIDDVLTTGATLAAAREALASMKVQALALAH